MFKRILVPLDGSTRAERALVPAADLARAAQGELVLLRVIDVPNDVGVPLMPPVSVPPLIDDAHATAAGYLGAIADRTELAGIPIKTYIQVGPAAGELLDLADAIAADAIIISSHGRTGFTRWMLGSVAQRVARHATVPVLVLRDGAALPHVPDRAGAWTLRVVVTLDGSPFAEEALPHAVALATLLNAPAPARLHLLLIDAPEGSPLAPADKNRLAGGAAAYLERTAAALAHEHAGLAVTRSVVVDSDPAAGIIRVPEQGAASSAPDGYIGSDVIVMASHGRSGLARWALGSVTERVLHGTKLPLLVVHLIPLTEPQHMPAEHAQHVTGMSSVPPLF